MKTNKMHYTLIKPFDVILCNDGIQRTVDAKDANFYKDNKGFVNVVLFKKFLRGEFLGWFTGAELEAKAKIVYQFRHFEHGGKVFKSLQDVEKEGLKTCQIVWFTLNKDLKTYREYSRKAYGLNSLNVWVKI